MEQACRALEFAEENARTQHPYPRDFIRAYLLLGELLTLRGVTDESRRGRQVEIQFYDEPFQQSVESVTVRPNTHSRIAERCLEEALRRCRKINLVESEPDILLVRAKLLRARGTAKETRAWEEPLKEAQEIAARAGYRLKLADIHLFCGQVLVDLGQERLLGLNAREHIAKAKEYAKDVSALDDLYKSPDPHFYDRIPQYEMLTHGMTPEQQIKNGYYVAWLTADALEKRL